jgi:hypothetical protein
VVWSFLQIFLPMPPIGKTIFALLGARSHPARPRRMGLYNLHV